MASVVSVEGVEGFPAIPDITVPIQNEVERTGMKLKHIEGEIPLYETRLPIHPGSAWGKPKQGESAQIVYAWHVLNCMPAFQLDVEPPKKGEFGFRED